MALCAEYFWVCTLAQVNKHGHVLVLQGYLPACLHNGLSGFQFGVEESIAVRGGLFCPLVVR